MSARPVLGDWEIPNVTLLVSAERRAFAHLPVPGLAGGILHDMQAEPVRIEIAGSLMGAESRTGFMESIRGKFQAGEATAFAADITTATKVEHVVVEDVRFHESAEDPGVLSFWMMLRESPPPPPPPDPLGGIDAGLLDDAAGLIDNVTAALDVLDQLGGVPDFADPTPPLKGLLGGVEGALSGLGGASGAIESLFGG